MALLASITAFTHVIGGVTNAGLRTLMTGLYNPDYTSRQASYDLRRLTRKGFLERVPGTNTYRITNHGRAIGVLFSRVSGRIVVPALAELLEPQQPPRAAPRPLRDAWRLYQRQLDHLIDTNIAA